MEVAEAASVLLEYPADWRPAAAAPEIPGLSITHPVALAPNGDVAHAGLVAGQLGGGEASPLPAQFVARLRALPATEVVNLVATQAYRYSQLSVPGFDRMLTLYVIPNPGGNPRVLACYASAGFAAYMRTCEQIVATLRLEGQPPSYGLAPDPGYARHVGALIEVLNGERVTLREGMRRKVTLATVQSLATRLAHGFASAAASLSSLEPTLAVAQARAMLYGSILRARDAYAALAAAAGAGSQSRYSAARAQVYEAEANINTALESFALLGYAHN